MKELRYVSFNLGAARVDVARSILKRYDLEPVASLDADGILAGFCSITLPAADPRLSLLLTKLEQLGVSPGIRAERSYTERKLDRFPWLHLRIRTAGLLGGYNLDQPYDRATACPVCGAGAVPLPPLRADLGRMGKKHIDQTAHDGHLVISRALAAAISEAGLTGVELLPVQRRHDRDPDRRFAWLWVTSEWGPMAPARVLEIHDLCPQCGRGGHYDTYSQVTEFWYDEPPREAQDFNATWEYFGRWRMNAADVRPHVGGARRYIVSQRVRACLRQLKVRQVGFEPVWFLSLHTPSRSA